MKEEKEKEKPRRHSFCDALNPKTMMNRTLGYASPSQSTSSGSGSGSGSESANSNYFDPLRDKEEETEIELSDATTAVIQVDEIVLQEPDQPQVIRTHSSESHDDEAGMVEEPIDDTTVPTPGESQGQPTLEDSGNEPAEEVKHKSSGTEDFPGASSE